MPHDVYPIPRIERQGKWPRHAYSISWWKTYPDGTLEIDVEFRRTRWAARRVLYGMLLDATDLFGKQP